MLTGTQPFYGANNQFSGTTTADMNAVEILVIMALVKYLRSNINKINEFSKIVASGDFSGRLTIDSQDEPRKH